MKLADRVTFVLVWLALLSIALFASSTAVSIIAAITFALYTLVFEILLYAGTD